MKLPDDPKWVLFNFPRAIDDQGTLQHVLKFYKMYEVCYVMFIASHHCDYATEENTSDSLPAWNNFLPLSSVTLSTSVAQVSATRTQSYLHYVICLTCLIIGVRGIREGELGVRNFETWPPLISWRPFWYFCFLTLPLNKFNYLNQKFFFVLPRHSSSFSLVVLFSLFFLNVTFFLVTQRMQTWCLILLP